VEDPDFMARASQRIDSKHYPALHEGEAGGLVINAHLTDYDEARSASVN
jgi:hypothetical protein